MAKKSADPPIELREFRSVEEVDTAIAKLERRVHELSALDIGAAVVNGSGADDVARSNIRATILEIFGPNSPEFREHQYIDIWAGPMYMNMSQGAIG